MLNINPAFDGQPRLVFDVSNLDDSTQREDLYSSLMNGAVAASINPIFDNEVAEFKPESQGLSFYVFFNAYKPVDWLQNVKDYVEQDFAFHLDDSLNALTTQAKKTITNPKTILQSMGIPTPLAPFLFHKTKIQVLNSMPYVVLDPVQQLTYTVPTKEGIPVFYNSLVLPYANSLDKWSADTLGFSNKTFLYNSFMLLDFYTTNNPLTQKKVMSVPVYVNGRYMDHEQSVKGVKQVRPVFSLDESAEGYSLIWLKQFKLDTLYVKLSFWDALNGVQIPLIPSTQNSDSKKWVQNPNTFRQENLYLQYSINYTAKTYKITEFNEKSGLYDIAATSFDAFQLVYDEYYSKLLPVKTVRPLSESTDTTISGTDISVYLSRNDISRSINAPFNDNVSTLNHIQSKYNYQPKGLLAQALNLVFSSNKVQLKDRAISYFEHQFSDQNYYQEDLGSINITNTTSTNLIIRKFEVENLQIVNKNNYMDGQPIVVNKFSKTDVNIAPSYFMCETVCTFQGSSFYRKLNPIKRPYDAISTAVFNKQADLYSNYYFDEASNKVAVKDSEDINTIINQVDPPVKKSFLGAMLMGGVGVLKWVNDKKQHEAKVKGLTMNDADLNLLMRSEVLDKSGATAQYEQLFPCTVEKLTHQTDNFKDFGVTIKTTVSPEYDTFDKGNTITLDTNVIFGKQFFKLFISGNDTITLSYDVAVSLSDENGTLYKKVIPCKLVFT